MRTASNNVLEQIDLIDRMIREGQASAEKWGWIFLLWGCGHVVALIWSAIWVSNPTAPWLITMGACWVIQMAKMVKFGRPNRDKSTTLGRAVGGSWAAFGIAMMFLLAAGSWKHLFATDIIYTAAFFVLIGSANFSSGVILRFRPQIAVALGWWLGAVAITAWPAAALWIFSVTVLLCEIIFGLYLMSLERKADFARD